MDRNGLKPEVSLDVMKTKIKELITVLIIQLVLSIPFYTVSVYATINEVTVKGSDGIEGFAKQTDFLQFKVQAVLANDTKLTNEQVILGTDIQFNTCTPSIEGGAQCTLTFPSNNSKETFEAKSIPFTVSLYKDDKTRDDSKSSRVTIDNKAPQITLSVSKTQFSSQENVIINYDAVDFACDDPSCANKCVGIKSVEFFTLNGSFNQKVDINSNTSSGCNAASDISVEPIKFNNGENSVFAKATDKFNQVSPETSVTFSVDTTAPLISASSFEILRKRVSLSTFSPQLLSVDVVVNISASDLNSNSVAADLSALNPSAKNIKASCSVVEDSLNKCQWTIQLNPKTVGLKTVTINASDTAGNIQSVTINKDLALDDKGPIVESLSTTTTQEGKSIAKPSGNTIIAVFDEASGLSADEVFLHIGISKITATSCTKKEKWTCSWSNINFGSDIEISIQSDTTDVLGNTVTDSKTEKVNIDNKPPVLINMSITPVGGLVQAFPGFFKAGDKIAVVANLTDDSNINAVADFSRFISGSSNVAGSCQRTSDVGNERLCAWLTDEINLANTDIITFNFSDTAGNSLTITKSLKTYGLVNKTTPDFWTNTFACSPSTIDRMLGALINQRSYCEVSLKPNSNKSLFTIFIGQATCTGDMSIVESVETFNTEAGSASPIIKITLKKDELKIDNATLNCQFDIFTKVGGSVTNVPEIETAKIELLFFNLPLGELSDKVKDKIEDAVEDAEGIWNLIEGLNKFFNIARKLCQLITTIYNIVALLYSFGIGVTTIDAFLQKWGIFKLTPVAVEGCKLQTGTRVVTAQPTAGKLNTFCEFTNCQLAFGFGAEIQNYINNENLLILNFGKEYVGQKTQIEEVGWGFKRVQVIGRDKQAIEKGKSSPTYEYIRNTFVGDSRAFSEYMDPRHNLIVAALFGCIPGVIYGLDKYRQIKCLYADCLQNAVGREGLPVTACEDQKAYATCKYVTSEIFAFGWFAVVDHFLGIIKGAFSNPFEILGVGASIWCGKSCINTAAEPRLIDWIGCEGIRLLNQVGIVAENFKNIIDEGFKIRQDYCSRLKDIKKELKEEEVGTEVKK